MARPTSVDPAWTNLAGLLVDRRVQLAPRYRNRRVFCDEKQVEYRVISDIEGARRDNFSGPMLTAIEVAYDLADGAIRMALDNPALAALPERGKVRPIVGPVTAVDGQGRRTRVPKYVPMEDLEPWEQHVWLTPDLTVGEREAAVHFLRLLRGDLVGEADKMAALLSTLQAIVRETAPARDTAQTP